MPDLRGSHGDQPDHILTRWFGTPDLHRLDVYSGKPGGYAALRKALLDMAPAEVMLITRHHDRPGTIGRLGALLGQADVNISAMHLARSAPREEALMILALDDEVPEAVASEIREHEAVLDLWTIRLGSER